MMKALIERWMTAGMEHAEAEKALDRADLEMRNAGLELFRAAEKITTPWTGTLPRDFINVIADGKCLRVRRDGVVEELENSDLNICIVEG